MIAAIIIPVLILGGGMAIDLGRLHNARAHAQEIVDAAALQGAASGETSVARLRSQAETYVDRSLNPSLLHRTSAVRVQVRRGSEVEVSFRGQTPAMFGAFFGVNQMDVSVSAATQRSTETLEVALVLDNTGSMADRDGAGVQKIAALRTSAEQLITTVATAAPNRVRFSLVPYAEYVNVGTQYRGQSWLSVESDRSGTQRWYGCVASRTVGELRLDDSQPQTPYPAFVDTRPRCPQALIPLTSDSSSVISAVRLMAAGGATYIPGGLIWGVNTLSPTAPFTQGATYDTDNRAPRKILVLMTDGANTLQFQASDGRHVGVSSTSQSSPEIQRTNADTLAICDYAKRRNIEIYTVALAVDSPQAQNLLRSCASNAENYFDARNGAELQSAFSAIASSINRVRLTH